MNNFDIKKYLSKNPLTEAYTPGSGWTKDFEYDDMMAHGLTLTADDSIEDLRKVAEDFTDVNYHREASPLYDAIDAIEAGDRGEAKMYINKFRKEIKNTLAGWDTLEERSMPQFDVETTEKVAQAVADAFTSEDTELDLKYVITPGTSESSFDLDVEAGPNTPGSEWKDKNGFGIENYLGKYAGGSFYIKDGVVYNAASRNAPVAKVSPEGEIEMISAEDSRAALGMEENKNENKTPNKMKKSELKEMIKAAMMAETSVDEAEKVDVTDDENVNVDDTTDVNVDDTTVVDDEENTSDIEVKTSVPGEDTDIEAVQGLLTKAQAEAEALGDEKLMDQIGNTITYFTRTHVVKAQNEIAAEPGEDGVEDVNIDNPAEDAMVGLTEEVTRMKKLAGLIK